MRRPFLLSLNQLRVVAMHSRFLACLLLGLILAGGNAPAQAADADNQALAAAVKEIFRTRCLECHGGSSTRGGVHILEHAALLEDGWVVAGEPDDSRLFELTASSDEDNRMPPTGQVALGATEVEQIRKWISAGAPKFPADVARPAGIEGRPASQQPAAGLEDALNSILTYLRSVPQEQRGFYRFFSTHHLLGSGATREQLDLHADALAKAINHLTWSREIVRPVSINAPANTIFAVDLRDLGWDVQMQTSGNSDDRKMNLFDLALLEYPYGVIPQDSRAFDALLTEYIQPSGMCRPIPFVRADWFVCNATQSPLYEDFLQLPFELAKLEKLLDIDAQHNIDSFKARRAGMTVSGVSRNNRVVERHPSSHGSYWKSFDFGSSRGQQNMFRDPIQLNPDGGEMIFSLPNGLQGYYVCDSKGVRIEEAPTSIVTDKFADDKVVRNGLACMRCHEQGMKGFVDDVRPAVEKLPGSGTFDRRGVLALYPEQEEMKPLVDKDGARFMKAMQAALGKPQGEEPLVPVSRRFLEYPLQMTTAAAEVGLVSGHDLENIFRLPQFASLGLLPLASGGVVRRDMWEDYFDDVVRHLGLGIPVVSFDSLKRVDADSPLSGKVVLRTNKPNGVFAAGDELVIFVDNKSSADAYVELIGTDARGHKVMLKTQTVIKPGESLRFPEEGSITIQPTVGREQITMLACPQEFPAARLIQAEGVAGRVVHDFYRLQKSGSGRPELVFDPSGICKQTLFIETR